MSLVIQATLICENCDAVMMRARANDDSGAVVDDLWSAARAEGWDTPMIGPDYCGACCHARCTDTTGDTGGAFAARKAVKP